MSRWKIENHLAWCDIYEIISIMQVKSKVSYGVRSKQDVYCARLHRLLMFLIYLVDFGMQLLLLLFKLFATGVELGSDEFLVNWTILHVKILFKTYWIYLVSMLFVCQLIFIVKDFWQHFRCNFCCVSCFMGDGVLYEVW